MEIKNLRHIAICGNIGSGKTTLATKLSKHYGWKLLLEPVDENPYLRDFYKDMDRWAFHVQVYFLNSRFRQLSEIRRHGTTTVQDRTIYEDAFIFAQNLYRSGRMQERDYATYNEIFDSMQEFIQPPDLLIYLKADLPKLVSQIKKRGRDYEAAISLDYLNDLSNQYDAWIRDYKLGKQLTIDVSNLDFEAHPMDFETVLRRIDPVLKDLMDH